MSGCRPSRPPWFGRRKRWLSRRPNAPIPARTCLDVVMTSPGFEATSPVLLHRPAVMAMDSQLLTIPRIGWLRRPRTPIPRSANRGRCQAIPGIPGIPVVTGQAHRDARFRCIRIECRCRRARAHSARHQKLRATRRRPRCPSRRAADRVGEVGQGVAPSSGELLIPSDAVRAAPGNGGGDLGHIAALHLYEPHQWNLGILLTPADHAGTFGNEAKGGLSP